MQQSTRSPSTFDTSDKAMAAVVFTGFGAGVLVWLGAACNALLAGSPVPRHQLPVKMAHLLRRPGQPSLAWGERMPTAGWYWTITTTLTVMIASVVIAGYVLIRRHTSHVHTHPQHLPGLASRRDVTIGAGRKAVLRRAATVRPSLDKPEAGQVGYRLGRAAGVDVWASVEDSMLLLGPPRSGKGLHLVIPMILDAPGAVVTTSTRPDNITATLTTRQAHGPVAVFDPQHLAPDVTARLRWSPIRGCDQPQTAMIRARALAAGTSKGVEGADFWQGQTEAVLRGFLHAAALDHRTPADLYRWSLSPAAAADAARILAASNHSAEGWAEALNAAIQADPRTRDSIWAGVRAALGCLADPHVLDAITPRDGHHLDPAAFLTGTGTLYLLGTSAGAGAAANLIGAFVEDIVEVARRTAAASPGARLDPPLALILDEVANYPLPSLPSLMSEGGGSGITTIAVLQSLAQARAKWGEHEGGAIWDSAIAKVILGGGSNARDLADLTALIGDRDEHTATDTRDTHGRYSTSRSIRRVPILDPAQLRTLPFGTAVLLLRSAAPIVLDLQPWTTRRPPKP